MSWHATSAVKRLHENLTRSEKFLLLILADYHNDETEQCDPSLETLARDALMSRRHVIRTVQRLAEKGFLAIERRRDESRQDSNQYNLLCVQGDTTSLGGDIQSDISSRFQGDIQSDIAVSPKPQGRTVRRNRKKELANITFLEERYRSGKTP